MRAPIAAAAGTAQVGRPACHDVTIRITTHDAAEFLDQTDTLQARLAEMGVCYGVLCLQTLHTTTAIVVNEHEPLLLEDFRAFLETTAPRSAAYRHDDPTRRTANLTIAERPNGHAHCQALMLPSSLCLNIVGGRLVLGRWQRVLFVELDGPRERELSLVVIGWAWP